MDILGSNTFLKAVYTCIVVQVVFNNIFFSCETAFACKTSVVCPNMHSQVAFQYVVRIMYFMASSLSCDL